MERTHWELGPSFSATAFRSICWLATPPPPPPPLHAAEPKAQTIGTCHQNDRIFFNGRFNAKQPNKLFNQSSACSPKMKLVKKQTGQTMTLIRNVEALWSVQVYANYRFDSYSPYGFSSSSTNQFHLPKLTLCSLNMPSTRSRQNISSLREKFCSTSQRSPAY